MNNTLSTLQNIDAQRADFAYEMAMKATGKYASHAKEFPFLIRNNSLPAAFLFANDKGTAKDISGNTKDESWIFLLNHCLSWLMNENCPVKNSVQILENEPQIKIISDLCNLQTTNLIQLTDEVLKFLEWIKRYAPEDPDTSI